MESKVEAGPEFARDFTRRLAGMMNAWIIEKTDGVFQRMPEDSMYARMTQELLEDFGMACTVRLMERMASYVRAGGTLLKNDSVYVFSVGDVCWDESGAIDWQSDARCIERISEKTGHSGKGSSPDWTVESLSPWSEVPLDGVFDPESVAYKHMNHESWKEARAYVTSQMQCFALQERAIETGFENAPPRRGPRL